MKLIIIQLIRLILVIKVVVENSIEIIKSKIKNFELNSLCFSAPSTSVLNPINILINKILWSFLKT